MPAPATFASLFAVATLLLSPGLADAANGDLRDDGGNGTEEGCEAREIVRGDADEQLAVVKQSLGVSIAPTIPMLTAGFILSFPATTTCVWSGASGGHSAPRGLLLGVTATMSLSLGTSIGGSLAANVTAGDRQSWITFALGSGLAGAGAGLWLGGLDSYLTAKEAARGIGSTQAQVALLESYLPAAIAGMACIITGEVLLMSSAGSIHDRLAKQATASRSRPALRVAAAPMRSTHCPSGRC